MNMISLISMLTLGLLMYFMIIRPQKNAAKAKQEMLENMKQGDHVVTVGGLHGVIDEIDRGDNVVVLDCEGVYLTFELFAIASVKRATPVNENNVSVDELQPEEYAENPAQS